MTIFGKFTRVKARTRDYRLVAYTLEEFVLRQERFIDRVSWRSQLPPRLIKSIIHDSATIMTFATLLGFDIASLKGAAIGAAVGSVIVVGNATVQIILVRKQDGIVIDILHA